MKCNLCPRKCNVDRKTAKGFCGCDNTMHIRKVMLHTCEEPILTDKGGKSGAIFFSGCNLRCVYCQNSEISHGQSGKEVSPEELARLFKKLEAAGASNIDLVTPTHFMKQIIAALKIYKPSVPVVYNTSGYETAESLRELEGLVDVYLTDFKYHSPALAARYSAAPDYPSVCIEALKEMKRQMGANVFKNGQLVHGIVVRHLVLPSCSQDSVAVLDEISRLLGRDAIVSIMSQFTPNGQKQFPELNRRLKPIEYKVVTSHALKLGLENSLVQDLDSATAAYTPNFDTIIDI